MGNKIAYITGATSGIGEASAIKLASEGFDLIITGRREERLETLKNKLISKYNIAILTQNYDVTKREEVEAAIHSLPTQWKQIDILVNNAGLASGLNTIYEGDINDWEKMIDTNIKGLLYVTRTLAPILIENNKGHIVNIGSIAGKEVYANGNVYCSTKFAVDALSKAMRLEFSKFPIKVTSINPGAVETEFSIVRFHGDEDRAKTVYEGYDNLLAEDIADAIWYVVSRPARVNINEMIVMPTAQPMAGVINRK
ncbi:MAG: SDR family NAD(P)-dependent oxidoreductase [Bacteroidetes bacterium]|jgi:NADP-dependent 3-hydroxy acid dehydrogenase YdfG|nr:SDR family NAD(P)-dependent oxidoreductase [Bacteroidota bacterium]